MGQTQFSLQVIAPVGIGVAVVAVGQMLVALRMMMVTTLMMMIWAAAPFRGPV